MTPEENRLLWTLRDLVDECLDCEGEVFNSSFIRAHASAIRLLAEYGHMEIIDDPGDMQRWVEARLIAPERTPNAFGKGVIR